MTDTKIRDALAKRYGKPSLQEAMAARYGKPAAPVSTSSGNEDTEGPFAIMRPSRPASAPNIGDALVAMQPEKVAEFAGEAGSLVEKSGFQLGRSALNTVFEGAAHMVELPAKGAKAFLQAAEPGMRRLGIVPDALPSVAYQQAVEEYRPMGAEDAAEAIRGQKAPPIAGMEGGIADKVGAGVGYAAQAVLVPGSVGAKLAFGATEAAASGFVTNLEVAKAEGASPQEALGAALAGAGIQAAASTLPLHKALTGLEKASGGLVGKALTDAIVFGGAGAGQSALNDVVLEHATGKDREILKNAAEAGMLGILTGPIVTALSVAAMAGARTGKQAITDKGPEVDLSPKIDTSTFVRGDDMPPDAGLGAFRAKEPAEAPFARGDDAVAETGLEMFRAKGEPAVEPAPADAGEAASIPSLQEHLRAVDEETRVRNEARKVSAPQPKPARRADAFLSDMSPMARKRAENALDNSITSGGKLYRRSELVELMVDEGATVVLSGKGTRRLQRSNGAYLDEAQISKTAMDYAEHLVARRVDNPASKRDTPPVQSGNAAAPAAAREAGKGGKQPWEMTRNEFDRYWVAKSKEGVAGEVAKKTAKDRIELDRLRKMISDDPGNPAIGSIKDQAARIEARIAEEQKRLTAPIKKPSEFMDQAQYRWHQGVDAALKEGKPVPPEVLADYPDLAQNAPAVSKSGEAAPSVSGEVDGAALPEKSASKKRKGSPEYEVIRSETEPKSKPILIEKKTGLILPDTIRTPDVGPIQEGRAAAKIGGNTENPYRRYIREQAAKNKQADDIYYEYARDWDSGFAGGKSPSPTPIPREASTSPTPEKEAARSKVGEGDSPKKPHEMSRGEFEAQYHAESKIKQFPVRATPVGRKILDHLFGESSHRTQSADWTVEDINQAIRDLKGRRQNKDTRAAVEYLEGIAPSSEKMRRAIVERALSEGKPVPPEVLADYPDLAAKIKPNSEAEQIPAASEPVAEPVVPKVEKPAVAEMPKGGAEAKTSTQSLSLTAKSPWESFLTAESNFIGGGKARPKEVLTDPEGRYVPRDETAIEASLRRIADRFHTLRRVEKEAPAPGQFSDAEVRMHGRAAYKHRQLEREQRSATNLMREAGVTAQDMADYATARHAEARNAIIRERTGGKTENGSGMNLARAKEILARATPAMKRIMEIHDRVRDRTREFMVESGLISRETADAWQRTFGDTYTPLKTIEDPGTEYIRGSGKSLQTRGPETKRAMGRSTEADNPFVQMFQDAQEAIARGEKNIVAQEFGKFAADNPSTAWEFVEPKNGHPPSGEDIFTYKVGGVEHYIRVSDEITLRALKNLDPVVSNRLFRAAMAGSRLMSGFATSRNPDFILPNFVRDLQTAAANISVEQGEKMAAKAVAGSFKAVHQIGKAVHSPEAAQGYAKEYLELGALTDWIEPQTIQKRLSGLDKMLKESTPRRGLREVAEVMNSIGSAVENGTRFAAYKEFRSAGIPAEKAVVLAKELTVNWSKKGEWGPFANSLYLFFSASANGTLRMGQVIRSNPAKAAKVAGAFVATGYAVAALNRAWGGKDEQDDKLWWDKQNDSNKRRYAMIQHQDGETTKMPLAPGWGFFYYLGTKLEEAAHTHKADIGNLVSALAEQTIPVGGGSPAQVVSPWFLDPVVQTSENKDFKGDPIYQERFPGDTAPYASHPDDRASETAKAISKLANELTGGTGVRRGSVDIPPRAIDHVTAEAGSGLGRFLDRVQRVARAKIKGEENPWREWPVISRFKGDKPDTYARDYRANMERLDVEEAAMKAGEKYDSAVVAHKRRAALFDKRVKALREAGMYEEAKRLMAAFNKDFPR